MSDFEFVFALYSLLLGLSMVQLLGGLGRAIEARFAAQAEREAFAIGWLTPLLAIYLFCPPRRGASRIVKLPASQTGDVRPMFRGWMECHCLSPLLPSPLAV